MNASSRATQVLVAALALGAMACGAAAQKVFRCGPDGRVYQQTPCSEGQAIAVDDARSAEQRKQAQAVARKEAKAAAKFDRDLQAAARAPAKPAAPASSAKLPQPKPAPPEKPTIYVAPAPQPATTAKP